MKDGRPGSGDGFGGPWRGIGRGCVRRAWWAIGKKGETCVDAQDEEKTIDIDVDVIPDANPPRRGRISPPGMISVETFTSIEFTLVVE